MPSEKDGPEYTLDHGRAFGTYTGAYGTYSVIDLPGSPWWPVSPVPPDVPSIQPPPSGGG